VDDPSSSAIQLDVEINFKFKMPKKKETAQDEQDENEEIEDVAESTVITLHHPIIPQDWICDMCNPKKQLSSTQSFVSHMATKHQVTVIIEEKSSKTTLKNAESKLKEISKKNRRCFPKLYWTSKLWFQKTLLPLIERE
jgi:hypothetical protein